MNTNSEEITKAEKIKNQIFDLVKEYHQEKFRKEKFIPGTSAIPVSGKVFDHNELNFMIRIEL